MKLNKAIRATGNRKAAILDTVQNILGHGAKFNELHDANYVTRGCIDASGNAQSMHVRCARAP